MIRYTTGNILESPAWALVNTVNTDGVMGKGLALQFKEAFPSNYQLYRRACKSGALDVGAMFVCEDQNVAYGKHLIINFPTKKTWRKPSEYEYIESGLQALRREIEVRQIPSIAIPPLGTHNGGLDWNRVRQMIEAALTDVDCDISIYEPSADVVERLKAERVGLTPARAMLLYVLAGITEQEEDISEFAAEKSAYFLQRFGATEQFKLKFHQHHYGPYSGKVRYVLHHLNGSYLKGMSDLNKRPFEAIWLLPDAKAAAVELLDKPENASYKQIAETTERLFEGMASAYALELLSTVDFIIQNEMPDVAPTQLLQSENVEHIRESLIKWNTRKQRMFADEKNITKAISHLIKFPQLFS